jgi:hypothetical protein
VEQHKAPAGLRPRDDYRADAVVLSGCRRVRAGVGCIPREYLDGLSSDVLDALGRRPSLAARQPCDQPIPSPRNRERSGEQRNAATLEWREWAGRLQASREPSGSAHAYRDHVCSGQSLPIGPSRWAGGPPHHRHPNCPECSWRARKARMPPRASRSA